MIEVTLVLHSARSANRNRVLGRVKIANDGTGDRARGNYTAVATVGLTGKPRRGQVRGFPRRSRNALELLRRALNAIAKESGL